MLKYRENIIISHKNRLIMKWNRLLFGLLAIILSLTSLSYGLSLTHTMSSSSLLYNDTYMSELNSSFNSYDNYIVTDTVKEIIYDDIYEQLDDNPTDTNILDDEFKFTTSVYRDTLSKPQGSYISNTTATSISNDSTLVVESRNESIFSTIEVIGGTTKEPRSTTLKSNPTASVLDDPIIHAEDKTEEIKPNSNLPSELISKIRSTTKSIHSTDSVLSNSTNDVKQTTEGTSNTTNNLSELINEAVGTTEGISYSNNGVSDSTLEETSIYFTNSVLSTVTTKAIRTTLKSGLHERGRAKTKKYPPMLSGNASIVCEVLSNFSKKSEQVAIDMSLLNVAMHRNHYKDEIERIYISFFKDIEILSTKMKDTSACYFQNTCGHLESTFFNTCRIFLQANKINNILEFANTEGNITDIEVIQNNMQILLESSLSINYALSITNSCVIRYITRKYGIHKYESNKVSWNYACTSTYRENKRQIHYDCRQLNTFKAMCSELANGEPIDINQMLHKIDLDKIIEEARQGTEKYKYSESKIFFNDTEWMSDCSIWKANEFSKSLMFDIARIYYNSNVTDHRFLEFLLNSTLTNEIYTNNDSTHRSLSDIFSSVLYNMDACLHTKHDNRSIIYVPDAEGRLTIDKDLYDLMINESFFKYSTGGIATHASVICLAIIFNAMILQRLRIN